MPRRNRRDSPHAPIAESAYDRKPETPEEMARELVRRGLASRLILTDDNRRTQKGATA